MFDVRKYALQDEDGVLEFVQHFLWIMENYLKIRLKKLYNVF